MIARDLTKLKSDYKGHPCFVIDSKCPCRPCYNCHDCTPPNPVHTKEIYSSIFHCATNWNKGCPDLIPEPNHILNTQKTCKRCKEKIK